MTSLVNDKINEILGRFDKWTKKALNDFLKDYSESLVNELRAVKASAEDIEEMMDILRDC